MHWSASRCICSGFRHESALLFLPVADSNRALSSCFSYYLSAAWMNMLLLQIQSRLYMSESEASDNCMVERCPSSFPVTHESAAPKDDPTCSLQSSISNTDYPFLLARRAYSKELKCSSRTQHRWRIAGDKDSNYKHGLSSIAFHIFIPWSTALSLLIGTSMSDHCLESFSYPTMMQFWVVLIMALWETEDSSSFIMRVHAVKGVVRAIYKGADVSRWLMISEHPQETTLNTSITQESDNICISK